MATYKFTQATAQELDGLPTRVTNVENGKQANLGFTPENINNKSTDGTLTTNSDTKYPSEKAVKTYVDNHSSSITIASQAEAEGNTDNAKLMTSLRVFQNWLNNVTNYVLSSLQTNTKTLIGSINELFIGSKSYHGVVNPNSVSFSVNNSTRTLTVAYNGTPYYVFIGGLKYTVSSDLSIQIGTGLGQHFVWFYVNNGNIVLGTSQTAWDILNTTYTPCATVYWDGSIMIPGGELHDYRRNLLEHKNQHDSWGAQYVSGFTGSPTFNVANTFSFIGGVIRDEEQYHTLSGTLTTCRVGYRVAGGATMTFDAIGTAFAKLNAGIIRYDNAGTLTDITNNNFGIYWVYATNRKESTALVSIVGQGNYSSVATAQAASLPTLAGLSVAEWKLLYRVILKRTGSTFTIGATDVLYNTSTGPAASGGGASQVSAGNVTFNPFGDIASTNVQSALEEVDTEKAPKASPIFNDISDSLKKAQLNLTAITSGQTRQLIMPDYDVNLGNNSTGTFNLSVNGNGGIIQVAQYGGYFKVPYNCTIVGWFICEGSATPVSTTSTMDVYKKSSFYPQAADTIFPVTKPSLTAATNNSATGLSIAVTAGDILTFAVTANNNAAILNLILTIVKS